MPKDVDGRMVTLHQAQLHQQTQKNAEVRPQRTYRTQYEVEAKDSGI